MRDRDLVRLYWPIELRPAFDALMGIDDAFAEVVASTSQPALGAIRLKWWAESLERLDHSPPPPEPRLQAVATHLLPLGISGSELGEIEAGWAALLDDEPDHADVAKRGGALFAVAGRLLGARDDLLAESGRLFALGDARRRGLIDAPLPPIARHRFARRLRPLTALAVLALRDPSEPEATPGRAWALVRHRVTGRIA